MNNIQLNKLNNEIRTETNDWNGKNGDQDSSNKHLKSVTIPQHSEVVTIPGHSETVAIPELPENYASSKHPESDSIPGPAENGLITQYQEIYSIPESPKNYPISVHSENDSIPGHSEIASISGHLENASIPVHSENGSILEHSETHAVLETPKNQSISESPENDSIPEHPENHALSEHPETHSISEHPETHAISEHPENDAIFQQHNTPNLEARENKANAVQTSSEGSDVGNPIQALQHMIVTHWIRDSWLSYRNNRKDSGQGYTGLTQFKMGILVCGGGIVALVMCLTVGLKSGEAACKKLLTVGTILGGAIAAIGGIWMTVAQPSHISKKKIAAVVAGLIGIGSLISTTMEQIKDWCPEGDKEKSSSFHIKSKNLLLIGGNSVKYGINHFITVYNPSTSESTINKVFLPMQLEGAVADTNPSSGLIMVAGGYNPRDGPLRNAFFYDEIKKMYSPLPPMRNVRNLAAGGWIDDTFIICGGMKEPDFVKPNSSYAEDYFTSSCEGFSLATNQWSALGNESHARAGTGYVIHNKHLYSFGGFDGDVTDQAAVYSFASNSWRTLPAVPGRRNLPAAVVYNNSIIICGGYFYVPLFDCVSFNPVNQQYTQSVPMVNPRYAFALVSINDNKVLAIGGKAVNNEYVMAVEMFDGNYWQQIGELSFGVSYFDAEISRL